MEIIFIGLCIAIGIGIPCSVSYIRKLKTARLVSLIILVFAVTMLAAGIIFFAVTEVTTCSTYEICTMCKGYGFTPAEEQCLVCKGAGKTLATTTMYSISLLYPVCMTVLGIYAMILRFALQEVIEKLEFVELRSIDEVSDHKNK